MSSLLGRPSHMGKTMYDTDATERFLMYQKLHTEGVPWPKDAVEEQVDVPLGFCYAMTEKEALEILGLE